MLERECSERPRKGRTMASMVWSGDGVEEEVEEVMKPCIRGMVMVDGLLVGRWGVWVWKGCWWGC